MGTITCARCHATVDEDNAYWEADGQLCQGCMDGQELANTYLKNLRSSAWSALAGGGVGLIINFWLVPSIIGVASGTCAVQQLMTKDPQEKPLAEANKVLWAPALVGLVLGALELFMGLVMGRVLLQVLLG